METLKPLFIEEQIEHFLNGTPPEQQKQIAAKIKFVKDNVSRIEIINGKKVYEPIVEDYYILFNIQETPEIFKKSLGKDRIYYYPIQYAEISFS